VHRARAALDRYGAAKAIVLARVIPLVRTVLNPLAGTVGVPVRTFTAWQVAGGLLCSLGVTLAGYALGSRIPNVDRYLLPIVAVIVVVSLIPTAGRHRRHRPAPIGLFDPAARRREALAGERGEADRNRDRRWGWPAAAARACACPVSQYARAAEAPVAVSQYSVMLSTTLSRASPPEGDHL